MLQRHLHWPDCLNVRDLGGIPTRTGRHIKRGALVRSDCVERLTPSGRQLLAEYGIRTVIDLRNDDERMDNGTRVVATLSLPLDGKENTAFWGSRQNGSRESGPPLGSTPLYYKRHVEHMPERSAAVLKAIAEAPEGGVLVHCHAGRDRTGLIVMLLLALLDVSPEDIYEDYALSSANLRARCAAIGEEEPDVIAAYLASKGTSAREVIAKTVTEFDFRACLRAGGLTDEIIFALRRRLLD